MAYLEFGYSNHTCTLLRFCNFGGPTPEGPFEYGIDAGTEKYDTLDKFKTALRSGVKRFDGGNRDEGEDSDYYDWGDYKVADMGAVYCTTSSLQEKTESYLRYLGFTQNGPFESKKYEQAPSHMSLWTIPVDKFLEAIK